ncbi:MAG: helix-turn-helix domain-containing protein [Lentihominibacter sp.]
MQHYLESIPFGTWSEYTHLSPSLKYTDPKYELLCKNEREMILIFLEQNNGHIEKIAKELQLNLRTLYRKIKKYNINASIYRNKT